jgi:hypothetical protein
VAVDLPARMWLVHDDNKPRWPHRACCSACGWTGSNCTTAAIARSGGHTHARSAAHRRRVAELTTTQEETK